jgi:hypothetical protein
MQRELFADFVAQTLEDVIVLAEEKVGKKLPRRIAFQWLGEAQPQITEGVVEYIVQRVYLDAEHIYPCVDLGVADLAEDGSLLIVGNVSGYPATTFRRNWTGREGPFVRIVGSPLVERMRGHSPKWKPEAGSFSYTIPDMKRPTSEEVEKQRTPEKWFFWKTIAKKFR